MLQKKKKKKKKKKIAHVTYCIPVRLSLAGRDIDIPEIKNKNKHRKKEGERKTEKYQKPKSGQMSAKKKTTERVTARYHNGISCW